MSGGSLTITKLGGDEPPSPKSGALSDQDLHVAGIPNPNPTGGRRRRKNTKTFPKGILRKTLKSSRIVPTRNPTRPSLTRRVRLTTDAGMSKTRKRIQMKASKTNIKTIREILLKKKIISLDNSNKIPSEELRLLYRDSVGAGLL